MERGSRNRSVKGIEGIRQLINFEDGHKILMPLKIALKNGTLELSLSHPMKISLINKMMKDEVIQPEDDADFRHIEERVFEQIVAYCYILDKI